MTVAYAVAAGLVVFAVLLAAGHVLGDRRRPRPVDAHRARQLAALTDRYEVTDRRPTP